MKDSLKEKAFIADCKKEAPQAARFFEKAIDFATKSMGCYKVGKGNTPGRRYYVVRIKDRVKKNCGIVSFCKPNIIEFYFNRLCEDKFLDESKAIGLYQYLQREAEEFELRLAKGTNLRFEVARNLYQHLKNEGELIPDDHYPSRGNVILLTELNDEISTDRMFEIYKEILEEVRNSLSNRNNTGSQRPRARGGTGEGYAHRTLKEHIRDNPLSVGVRLRGANAEVEKKLPSGDTVDVFFENDTTWIGAEVKSDQSSEDDIRRGLYQCVKYRAVMEAECSVRGIKRNIRVLLALGGPFPQSLLHEKTVLDIEVRDGIMTPG